MYQEKNIKQVKSGGILVYKVHNHVKEETFYIARSCKKYTLEQFLEEVNQKFIERFGFEPNFHTKHSKNALKDTMRIKTKRTEYEVLIANRWASINQRCVGGKYAHEPSVRSNLQHISYKKKDVRLEMTFQQFYDFMMSVKHIHDEIVANGDKSSVNRIDSSKGYSIENVELIALHKNIEERYGKECEYTTDKNVVKRNNARKYAKSQQKEGEE